MAAIQSQSQNIIDPLPHLIRISHDCLLMLESILWDSIAEPVVTLEAN